MSQCGKTCKRPTIAQAHCQTCHNTFSGVTLFDAHRSYGRCLDVRRVLVNDEPLVLERGVWGTALGHAIINTRLAALEQARLRK